MSLLDDLQWRYATKAMNGEKVSEDKIDAILEAIRMAPTSSGLQPFHVFVITNPELKEKIKPIANGQTVITDCSHLLVFAAWDNYTEENIKEIFDATHDARGFNPSLDDYRTRLNSMYVPRPAEVNYQHAARQAYIAFGIALAAAAEQKVDATPIEGFNPAELDAFLELDKKGLKSVTLLPLGYRDNEKDWLLPLKKVRKPKEVLFTEL